MNLPLFSFAQSIGSLWQAVRQRLRQYTKPDTHSLTLKAALDLTRAKSELVLENALLPQQLIVLQRHVKYPPLTWRDRALFVLLASWLRAWKEALIIVQPDTVLRWHHELFRWIWRRKSKSQPKQGRPTLDVLFGQHRRGAGVRRGPHGDAGCQGAVGGVGVS